jgi:Arc/MetJ family transcription regulator
MPELTDICFFDMHICMRTTLNIDDDLMRTVKKRAAEKGTTVSATIETALRELLRQEKEPKHPYRLRWHTVRGKVQAGVDLTDRDALLDRMEGRS